MGPTAVGKTAVAHSLARRRRLPVLSADSMLVYRGMDIGTAKPTPDERGGILYIGLDLADPGQAFSVAHYLQAVRDSAAGHEELIAVGGTGLYIRCLLQGLDAVAPPNEALRARAAGMTVADLQHELGRKAPGVLAGLRDPSNPRRLVRALEQAEAGGERDATWRDAGGTLVGLRMPAKALAARIEARVQGMYRNGLIEEARTLRERGALSCTAAQAIGYAEAFAVLDGGMKEKEAMARTATRTRQLAKRQMTWFRNQARVEWIEIEPDQDVESTADRVDYVWRQHGPNPLRI